MILFKKQKYRHRCRGKKTWTLREKADEGMNWKLGTDTY